MADTMDDQLEYIDRDILAPLVRQTLGSETVEITEWRGEQIHGGVGAGSSASSAIHRVSGTARDRDRTLDWSLILKVLAPPDAGGQPTDWNYWRREACAYESGLLADLPGGLAAPECFGVADQPDGTCWIWLEHVEDDIGEKWPLEHYGVVARHLGRFSGAYVTGRPLPSYPWLSRHGLRHRMENAARGIELLQESLDHPLVRRAYLPERVSQLLRRWASREEFLQALDRLPQTLCHFDAFRRNLFTREMPEGGTEVVAIDWAMVGIGPLGQEIRALVGSTLTWRGVDSSRRMELDDIVFAGYLDGLRDVGWDGDPRLVRFGQAAQRAMVGLDNLTAVMEALIDESQYAWVEQTFGISIEEFADRQGHGADHPRFACWEEEAHRLLRALSAEGW